MRDVLCQIEYRFDTFYKDPFNMRYELIGIRPFRIACDSVFDDPLFALFQKAYVPGESGETPATHVQFVQWLDPMLPFATLAIG